MAKNRLADWDTTAANNTDIAGINIDEGWAPENVNNAAREKMSQLAEFFKDTTGQITSTNVGNAYSITTKDGITVYAAGQRYVFISNAANTGAATLNVNTIGAKSIVAHHDLALVSGDIEANQIVEVVYEATDDTFQMVSPLAQPRVDIANLTTETDLDPDADSAVVYDATATANREVLIRDVRGTVQIIESSPKVSYTSHTTVIPLDDTIPQQTEGEQIITNVITPKDASNSLVIECSGYFGSSTNNTCTMALFQDATANALAATSETVAASNHVFSLNLRHEMLAGTTSATTFKIRIGPTSGTMYANGIGTGRIFGGLANVRLRITEYTPELR